MRGTELEVGDTVDGWQLERLLGRGGNAQVWLATRGAETAALKVLWHINPDSEPFQRFRSEVDVLRKLGPNPGILPLIDASLPDRPSKGHRAWLAMPVATPLRDSLGSDPKVDDVIRAHEVIARTLADLQDQHQIFHRDIKPQNLYAFEGRWCLGDFGLVAYPDAATLTAPGRWVGPVNYLAPEMLLEPSAANPGPVDVYALAKTFWAIMTRYPVPIPGPLDRRFEACRLTSYVKDDRLNSVELLLERCTRHARGERPNMRDVAAELSAWQRQSSVVQKGFDPAALQVKVAPLVTRHFAAKQALEDLWNAGSAMLATVQERLTPLRSSLADALGIDVGLAGDNRASNLPSVHKWFQQPAHRTYQCVSLWAQGAQPFAGGGAVQLIGGIAIFFTSDVDRIAIAAGWGVDRQTGTMSEIWGTGESVVPGSSRASVLLECVAGLFANAERAVQAFADALP